MDQIRQTAASLAARVRSSPAGERAILEIAAGLAIFRARVFRGRLWDCEVESWSRILSVILNWLNIGAAVPNVARFRTDATGAIRVRLSCLVLRWRYVPTTKLQFRNGSGT
jgi:hypothetical protein